MTSTTSQKRFGLIGASGYVAPRHMRAIRDTGHQLLAAFDPFDSVGVIDQYFPGADFFVEFERFDRHLEKKRRAGEGVDFLSICSPNYLHDAHIRFGLRLGADVICEKPLVLNPWNVDALGELAEETGRQVYNILQLRLHPSVIALRQKVQAAPADHKLDIDLSYITSRGHWYHTSWKGDLQKSGGIATNIGVHFFDMLIWIFGSVQENVVHIHTHDRAAGYLELERARVRWFLSIHADTLPASAVEKGQRTWRSLTIGGEEFEFSEGFTDLHTLSYQAVLEGRGFPLETARPAIEVVYDIRHAQAVGLSGEYHPLAALPLTAHPFNRP
jgi:UDP-N-acetyl-2-amino-2-deoxyglucuronate dehydrogenase